MRVHATFCALRACNGEACLWHLLCHVTHTTLCTGRELMP